VSLERNLIDAMKYLVKGEKGGRVLIWPKRLALMMGGAAYPVKLSIINHILKQLCDEGLILPEKGGCRRLYIIPRGSPLWELLENGEAPSSIDELIRKCKEFKSP